jgi:hypothetical protein
VSKPITAAKVRAVLRKAGHRACQRHTTMVRGWYDYSPGFRVVERGDGRVIVAHQGERYDVAAVIAAALTAYRDALAAAGIATVEDEGWLAVVPAAEDAP